MDKSTLHPDLDWIKNQFTYNQLAKVLHIVGMCRYCTFKQIHSINHRVGRKGYLVKLQELGYLLNNNPVKAYSITEKSKQFIELEGYNAKILQTKLTGQTLEHALKITDTILKLQPSIVFYPQFKEPPDYQKDWLKPDACLIYKNDTGFKISFLEVEDQKNDWENYLLRKRLKYERLAGLPDLFFLWWKYQSERLGLPFGKVDEFCFSVCVVGNIKYDWEGWEWKI